MIKISDATKDIIINQPFLMFGMRHRLLNLSSIAKFIKPLIEARVKKPIKETAVLMNLSRLQKILSKKNPKLTNFFIDNLSIHSNLCSVTYLKSEEVFKKLNLFDAQIQKENGYITLSQGTGEITLIIEEKFLSILKKYVSNQPKYLKNELSSISIQFNHDYVETPCALYNLTQQISLQNINIWEISSTYTELIFYIDKRDLKLAFDTLDNLFRA